MYGISVFLGEEITNDTIIYIKKDEKRLDLMVFSLLTHSRR